VRGRGARTYPRTVAADPLLSIAEELYSLAPSEFTGTRNQWARQTRADGDRELAERVGALRRPATAAWVVNMLMRHQAEQMTQVLDLGASLRQAQSDLDGDALRELTRQRRQLTTAVTQQGRELARDLGQKVTESVAGQVQDTLHAAMVDEGAAAAVRSGMLVAALSATGVEQAEVAEALAVPSALGLTPRARTRPAGRRTALRAVPGRPEGEGAADQPDGADDRLAREREEAEARRRARAQAVDEARASADEERRRLRKVRKRVSRLEARTLQVADELEQLRRRAAELEHELDELDERSARARTRRDRVERRYARAQDALAEAQRSLDEDAEDG
jgi:chromosome segregation ATPase